MSDEHPSLVDLPDVPSMARYVYGEATRSTIRRVRHLISIGEFPAVKVGARWESRTEWVDARYADRLPRANGS